MVMLASIVPPQNIPIANYLVLNAIQTQIQYKGQIYLDDTCYIETMKFQVLFLTFISKNRMNRVQLILDVNAVT